MGISTSKLNKLWYLVVTPYNTKGYGKCIIIILIIHIINLLLLAINQNVRIEVSLEGMNYAADNMTLLVRNTTLVDDIICLEVGRIKKIISFEILRLRLYLGRARMFELHFALRRLH